MTYHRLERIKQQGKWFADPPGEYRYETIIIELLSRIIAEKLTESQTMQFAE